jgi:hypothetical protein
MNNDSDVEISYLSFESVFVKRRNKIDEFLDEIYSRLVDENIFESKKPKYLFDGFIYNLNGVQKEINSKEIYSKSVNPTLKEIGLDKCDYLTLIHSEPDDFENQSNSFQDLSKLPLVESGFSKSAPDYRKVNKGLSGEGKCNNKQCVAYGKKVLNTIRDGMSGYGTFDIIRERQLQNFVCPKCKKPIFKFTNYRFFLCKYNWEGFYHCDETGECETKYVKGIANSKKGSMKFTEFNNENNKDFISYKFEIQEL